MPTLPQLRGIAQSAQAGRSFVRFEFNPGDIDSFVEDFNYASTQGAIRTVTELREIGQRVLAELKSNFPERKSRAAVRSSQGYRQITPKSLKLKEGWRVKFYDAAVLPFGTNASAAAPSLLGFYIDHRNARSERIRTILASLEGGSRPYRIFPVEASALRFPNGYPRATDQVFAKHADIPARKGFGYLEKTRRFADQLLASKGSQMEAELVGLLERAHRFKIRTLSAESVKREATPAIEAATESFSDVFAKSTNPLRALRSKKKSMLRRKG